MIRRYKDESSATMFPGQYTLSMSVRIFFSAEVTGAMLSAPGVFFPNNFF